MPYKKLADKIAWRIRYQQSSLGKEASARWRNSKRGRVYNNRWRKLNGKAAQARWWKSPKGKLLNITRCARRRAHRTGASLGNYTAIKQIYAREIELRQWFDVVVDHIIPLSKGGSHEPDNLQIIYRKENIKKSARLDFQPVVIFR